MFGTRIRRGSGLALLAGMGCLLGAWGAMNAGDTAEAWGASPSAGLAPAALAPSVSVETHQLDNGLTVLLSRDQRLPVVAVEVRYLVGSANEPAGRSGFAHLFEHLMFQGSANFDEEYFEPFQKIGGSVNGTTNTDRTNYYERVPKEYLELALWMESDRMGGLLDALTQAKLDNQRDVVKNERRQRYENTPYGMASKYFNNHLYPEGHPYQHTVIGSHEDLTAATLDDVKAFFTRHYVASNAIVTVVGDFDPPATLKMVERYFGSITKGTRTPTPEFTPPANRAAHIVETDDVKLPRVHLAFHSPAYLKPGDAALDIFSSILTGGKTSRLYKPLVYDKKVAKDVSAYQASRALGSYFVVQATAAPGVTVEALHRELDAALRTALATPPTDDEMARAVNGWRKSFFARVESVIYRAQMLSTYRHLIGRADYIGQDLARYTTLTPPQVAAAAKTHVTPDAALRVDILPAPAAAEEGR
ncbi:MAG: pitrilysin family protein [Myxococcota bacterium]